MINILNLKKALFLILIVLFACGPRAEEKAKIQKAREDSIRFATENATKLRFEKKLALTEELKNAVLTKEKQENRLSYLKGELEVQKDKLTEIKQPQFLRTPGEREQQIRTQVMTIEQAEKDIKEIKDEIGKTEVKISELKIELKNYE